MNYRHAFHAGNFADVLKHIVLTRILLYLQEKPAAFRVIDTHAGSGLYDLTAPEAERSGAYHYMTSLPSMFMVGHVDYMRIVSMRPLGPEETELTAEWLFPATTLADPNADVAKAIDFAKIVLEQDADACELNQRGIRAVPAVPAFRPMMSDIPF